MTVCERSLALCRRALQGVKHFMQRPGHNSEELGASDSANRLGVRQLAAALEATSLLVVDSAILEPGNKLPGTKAQASLRTPR